jgi:hypothetical protein
MIESMHESVVYLVVFVVLVAVAEAGYAFGRCFRHRLTDEQKSHLDAIMAGLLGLLGLLLAFAFGLSASRFDTRKRLVLDEANAIGTTYLRAQGLPAPPRAEIQSLLRTYIEQRLAVARQGAAKELLDEAVAIQRRLWTHASALLAQDPRSIPRGLFAESVNQVIDLHGARVWAFRDRVPEGILYALGLVAVLGMGLLGVSSGLKNARNLIPTTVMALAVTTVLVLIVDLDRPERGVITVSQQPLVDLSESMAGPVPPSTPQHSPTTE